MRLPDGLQPLPDASLSDGGESEIGDAHPTNQESKAIQGVRNGHRSQPAKDGIDGTDDADHPNRQSQLPGLGSDARQSTQIQNASQALGAGVENNGQENAGIGDDENQGSDGSSRRVKALLQEFRYGSDATAQVFGKKK